MTGALACSKTDPPVTSTVDIFVKDLAIVMEAGAHIASSFAPWCSGASNVRRRLRARTRVG